MRGLFYPLLIFLQWQLFWLIKVLFMVPGGKCLLYYTVECQFSLLSPGRSNAIWISPRPPWGGCRQNFKLMPIIFFLSTYWLLTHSNRVSQVLWTQYPLFHSWLLGQIRFFWFFFKTLFLSSFAIAIFVFYLSDMADQTESEAEVFLAMIWAFPHWLPRISRDYITWILFSGISNGSRYKALGFIVLKVYHLGSFYSMLQILTWQLTREKNNQLKDM